MFKNYIHFFYLLVLSVVISSCAKDDAYIPIDDSQVSPVVFDIEQVPYATLSEYNFFDGDMKDLNPVYGVLPYDLITPLFSDYAHKKRFIWMPDDVTASYVNDYSILDFPVGTVLIKNFYYDNVLPSGVTKIIETRLQIKKETGWVFACYKWNDEQTQASFDLSGSYVPLTFMENGIERSVNYYVPSGSQCFTCHKSISEDVPYPIGVKPQNLNRDFDYPEGSKNQLQKLVDFGYVDNTVPSTINSVVKWDDESQPLELRVRSYLDINCAHCHSDNGHCDYRPVRFAFNESSDITNLGVCVDAHEVFDPSLTLIVNPGNSERSVLAARLNSTEEEVRMPLLARTLRHDEGVQLIEAWINSLTNYCE